MAEKIKRERARWNDQIVTIIKRTRTKVQIRDAYGFTHEVKPRDLKQLDKDEPLAEFSYEEAD